MANKQVNVSNKTLELTQLGVFSALILIMSFVPYIGFISYGAISITLIHIPMLIGAIVLGPKAGAILGGVWGVATIIRALTSPPSPIEGSIFWNPLVALVPRVLAGLVAGLIFVLVLRKDRGGKVITGISAALAGTFSALSIYGAIGYANQKAWWSFAGMTVIAILFLAVTVGAVRILFAKEDIRKNTAAGIASVMGTVTNTVLVVGSMYIFYGTKFGQELGIQVVNFGGFLKYIMAAFSLNAVLEIVVAIIVVVPISMALLKAQKKLSN